MARELAVIKIIIICQVIVYISIVLIVSSTNSFTIVDTILDNFDTFSVFDRSRYLYFIAAFQMMILFETGIRILHLSYKPSSSIMPFPISLDVINSFQQAILMPLSTNHFYLYLESLQNYEEALIIFGLHTDITLFNKMVEESAGGDMEECRIMAIQIFEDYIVEDCRFQAAEDNFMHPIEEQPQFTDTTARMSSLMDEANFLDQAGLAFENDATIKSQLQNQLL